MRPMRLRDAVLAILPCDPALVVRAEVAAAYSLVSGDDDSMMRNR